MKKLCVCIVTGIISIGVMVFAPTTKVDAARISPDIVIANDPEFGAGNSYITVQPNNVIKNMGKGIDLSYPGLDHIKSSLFTDSYSEKLVDYAVNHAVESPNTRYFSYSSLDISDLKNKVSNQVITNLNIVGSDGNSLVGSINVIGSKCLNQIENNNSSNYYYYESIYKECYRTSINKDFYLPDNISKNNGYRECFLKDLEEMASSVGTFKYNEFFETYGTHVLSSAVFGGAIEAIIHVSSMSYSFNEEVQAEFEEKAKAAINMDLANDEIEIDVDSKSKFLNSTKYSYMNNSCEISVDEIGLLARQANANNSNVSFSYENWNNSLSAANYGNVGLLSFGGDKIYGIWDVIPNEFKGLKDTIQRECTAYLNRIQPKEDKYGSLETGKLPYHLVRSDGIIVKDEYVNNNHMDLIRIDKIKGYVGLEQYKERGYTKMLVTLRFQAKEINDGYAEIYCLDEIPTSKYVDGISLHYWKRDLPSDSGYYWYETSFEVDISKQLFYICYDASGSWNDDWSNQNMLIKITFLK